MAKSGSSSSKTSASKPYDRPPLTGQSAYQLKYRGKSKTAATADSTASSSHGISASNNESSNQPGRLNIGGKNVVLDVGAPATIGQTSRKGKKAWRKNIDLRDVEGALEEAREEERITGGKLSERSNGALFTVDTTGDATLAENLRKNRPKKQLRSLAILSERSAIPSLSPRTTFATSTPKVRPQEKARLRRIALREHRPEGQSASQIPTVLSTASADAWATDPKFKLPGGFGEDVITATKNPKFPVTMQRRREAMHGAIVDGRTVDLPEAGTSYNPTLESHKSLIDRAVEEEKTKLVHEALDLQRIQERGLVIENRKGKERIGEYAEGMIVGPGEETIIEIGEGEDETLPEGEGEGEEENKKKVSKRKTQAQRNKAIRLRDLAEAEKIAKQQSKLAKSIGSLTMFKKAEQERAKKHEEAAKLRKEMKADREAEGIFRGGERIGKYTVKKGDVAVQLGEDLAETLRQVKPEGNQFKDQFLALQRKGLVEPRLPQSKKQKAPKMKEYEKHAYKRFV